MSQDHDTQRKGPGRPPSLEARRKALAAAHAILMEEGFGWLTMEAVAARAGVGKPTIYRSWANASELAMAALMLDDPAVTEPGSATLERALRRQMRSLVRTFATPRGRQITMTLAAADPGSELTKAFRHQVILSSRETGRVLIEAAYERDEIGLVHDIDVLLDMIYGPVFYRLLVGHAPLDDAFAMGLVDLALRMLGGPGRAGA